jgi:uncharacterized protein (TIGR03435 family)
MFSQLQFEVASIKPAGIADPASDSLYTDPSAGLHVVNFPLKAIILFAFDLRDFQLLGGPGWIEAERYNISAKVARDGSAAEGSDEQRRDHEFRERIRSLLANRFALLTHRETRDLTAYTLTVARGGPKLKAVGTRGDQYGFRGGRGGRSQGFAITMPMFAKELARITGRPVVDKTGLAGEYDYVLQWTPDTDTGSLGPTIFTALQDQLGLRLESTKAPVDTIIIDHVERPSEN